jgi:hypothetical protein
MLNKTRAGTVVYTGDDVVRGRRGVRAAREEPTLYEKWCGPTEGGSKGAGA